MRFVTLALLAAAAGCSAPDPQSEVLDVKVATEDDFSWAQYQANLAFAQSYTPTCVAGEGELPRILVTGFGRFQAHTVNATGQLVSGLLSTLEYPLTEPPAHGSVDPPELSTRVAMERITLPDGRDAEVCGMVLPVFWDLAAVLIVKELEAFDADFVLMNGIASSRQDLWLELGSLNRASALGDGSGVLAPVEEGTPLVPSAPPDELARPHLLSWWKVRDAAAAVTAYYGEVDENGVSLATVLPGVKLAGYPRSTNTYLCNNVSYTVGYLMDHPGEVVRLMEASQVRDGSDGYLDVVIERDHRATPRVFAHWPSELEGVHRAVGIEVLRTVLAAQLEALASGDEPPFHGDNAIADLPPDGQGDTF
jgi:pyrrolidone-carboxylate peptidase